MHRSRSGGDACLLVLKMFIGVGEQRVLEAPPRGTCSRYEKCEGKHGFFTFFFRLSLFLLKAIFKLSQEWVRFSCLSMVSLFVIFCSFMYAIKYDTAISSWLIFPSSSIRHRHHPHHHRFGVTAHIPSGSIAGRCKSPKYLIGSKQLILQAKRRSKQTHGTHLCVWNIPSEDDVPFNIALCNRGLIGWAAGGIDTRVRCESVCLSVRFCLYVSVCAYMYPMAILRWVDTVCHFFLRRIPVVIYLFSAGPTLRAEASNLSYVIFSVAWCWGSAFRKPGWLNTWAGSSELENYIGQCIMCNMMSKREFGSSGGR